MSDILKKTFSEATRQSFIYIKHVDIKLSVHVMKVIMNVPDEGYYECT
jgi:hypothetical protein